MLLTEKVTVIVWPFFKSRVTSSLDFSSELFLSDELLFDLLPECLELVDNKLIIIIAAVCLANSHYSLDSKFVWKKEHYNQLG